MYLCLCVYQLKVQLGISNNAPKYIEDQQALEITKLFVATVPNNAAVLSLPYILPDIFLFFARRFVCLHMI